MVTLFSFLILIPFSYILGLYFFPLLLRSFIIWVHRSAHGQNKDYPWLEAIILHCVRMGGGGNGDMGGILGFGSYVRDRKRKSRVHANA